MYLLVSMSPLKMVSKTMNKKGNIALFYFAAPSSAAVLTFYKISCLFHFTTHLAYRINALQKDVIFMSSNKTVDTIGHQCMLCEFLAYKSDKFLRNKLFNNVPLCDSSVD